MNYVIFDGLEYLLKNCLILKLIFIFVMQSMICISNALHCIASLMVKLDDIVKTINLYVLDEA